jgi:Rieske Fe-S protein
MIPVVPLFRKNYNIMNKEIIISTDSTEVEGILLRKVDHLHRKLFMIDDYLVITDDYNHEVDSMDYLTWMQMSTICKHCLCKLSQHSNMCSDNIINSDSHEYRRIQE